MESDESELMILKNRHEKTTDRPLDDLLVKLFMQKTVGPLQQHEAECSYHKYIQCGADCAEW